MQSIGVLIYALFLIVYGYIGYTKTGSLISLLSSFGFGGALLVCCFGMYLQKRWGYKAAIFLSSLLVILFSVRWILTHKTVPMVLTIASVLALFFLLSTRKLEISFIKR